MVPLKYLPYEGDIDDRVAILQGMYNCAKGRPGLIQVKEGGGPKIRNRTTLHIKAKLQMKYTAKSERKPSKEKVDLQVCV